MELIANPSVKEKAATSAMIWKLQMHQIMEKIADLQLQGTYEANVIYKEIFKDDDEEIKIEDLDEAPPKIDDIKPQVHAPWKRLI